MWINGRMREREKKNTNDIKFQYVRSMSNLRKRSVIKHQYAFIPFNTHSYHTKKNLLIEIRNGTKNQELRANKD